MSEKGDKSPLPGLAVDGQRIRAIREEKRLTQLYVASVVGVTTDTISRWENNRYPSIRRDNAEKLAQALEVSLAEILQQEEAPAPVLSAVRPRRRTPLPVILAVVAAVVLAAWLIRPLAMPVKAVRWLPRFTPAGEVVPVQIKVSRRAQGSQGFVIRERLPDGWTVVGARPEPAPGPSRDSELKWLIPGGSGNMTISYTARPPLTAAERTTATFSGTIVAHEAEESRRGTIGGITTIVIAPCHWADQKGDGRIDDNEIMPAYYLTEEMAGMGLDWPTIEAIWSGKGYRWDPSSRRFMVVN